MYRKCLSCLHLLGFVIWRSSVPSLLLIDNLSTLGVADICLVVLG